MKKKIVLWGNDASDQKILIALELKAKENHVNVHTFKEEIVTEAFYNQMMDDWRSGKTVDFPEGHETQVRELSVTADILPETIKVQRGDLINRAKAEWHFVVLSTKLYDLYNSELSDIKDRIEKLVDFDKNIWEEVKNFWSKVSEQSRERNLFRDHADKLKDETNALFTQLKEFKTKANAELAQLSKEHVANFTTRLDAVKTKVTEGKSLSPLFDELKKIQNDFNGTEFTRNDRSKVWKRIDEAFKVVKEKKYGKQEATANQGALSRLERRYQGLKSAIGKMESSINRDKKDIDFQNKRAGNTMGQLEMQLRQAKVMMVEERINSKQEKLDEMLSTKVELEKRMEKEKEREAKKAEKAEVEKKKAEVKAKLQAEMAENKPEISEEEAARLAAAAADINAPKRKGKSAKADKPAETVADKPAATTPTEEAATEAPVQEESLLSAAATMIEEAVENVVDTVKAVSSVVSDKVEDSVEAMKASADDSTSDTADTEAKVGETLMKGGLLATAVAAGSKLIKDAVDKMEEVSEEVRLDKTIDKARETLEKTTSAISGKAEEDTEVAAEKANEVKEAAAEKVETVKETVAEAKEAVTETAVDAKETVSETVTETTPEAKDDKGSVLAKGGMLGAAIALGSKVMDSVSDKIEDVAESLGVDDAIDAAKDKLEDAKDMVTDKVDDLKASVANTEATSEASVDEVAKRVSNEMDASSEEE